MSEAADARALLRDLVKHFVEHAECPACRALLRPPKGEPPLDHRPRCATKDIARQVRMFDLNHGLYR